MNFKKFLKKFNQKNLDKTLEKIDKGMATFDRGMAVFNKSIRDFGDSMDNMNKEFQSDNRRSHKDHSVRERRNKENLSKIWGNGHSNHPKIWSDKKSKESLF